MQQQDETVYSMLSTAYLSREVISDRRLSDRDVIVYAAILMDVRAPGGYTVATAAELGRRCCKSARSVQRALKALESAGYTREETDPAAPSGRRIYPLDVYPYAPD